MITIKTPEQVGLMRAAGLVVGRTLELLREAAVPGVRTRELDALAEQEIRRSGGVPSFLGYHGFPASICASVNDEIVHGIPGERALRTGDLISIDCGAVVDGWHGDAAITVAVGDVEPKLQGLITACEQAMWTGVAAARVGARLGDISSAIETSARTAGGAGAGRYGVVRDYAGHGIGTEMHQDPPVPNYGRAGRGPSLQEGLVLAIEPMLTLGRRRTRVRPDGWTVVTADGSPAAHFEHTVALTAAGPWVLTALDGGAGRLGAAAAPVQENWPSPPSVG